MPDLPLRIQKMKLSEATGQLARCRFMVSDVQKAAEAAGLAMSHELLTAIEILTGCEGELRSASDDGDRLIVMPKPSGAIDPLPQDMTPEQYAELMANYD